MLTQTLPNTLKPVGPGGRIRFLPRRDTTEKTLWRQLSFCLLCGLVVAAASLCPAETNSTAPAPGYEFRAVHDPDGIGKFYLGCEIAGVMGHQAADWLKRPERQREERTDLLIPLLKLKPGDTVADIGAGTGD